MLQLRFSALSNSILKNDGGGIENNKEEFLKREKPKLMQIVDKYFQEEEHIFVKEKNLKIKKLFEKKDIEYLKYLFDNLLNFKYEHKFNLNLIICFLGNTLFLFTFIDDENFLSIYDGFLLELAISSLQLFHLLTNELLPSKYIKVFIYKFESIVNSCAEKTPSLNIFFQWSLLYFTLTDYKYVKLTIKKSVIIKYIKLIITGSYLLNYQSLVIANIVFITNFINHELENNIFECDTLLIINLIYGLIGKTRKKTIDISNALVKYKMKVDPINYSFVFIDFFIVNKEFQSSLIEYFDKRTEENFLKYFMMKLFSVYNKRSYENRNVSVQNMLYNYKLNSMKLILLNYYYSNWSFLLESVLKKIISGKILSNMAKLPQIITIILDLLYERKNFCNSCVSRSSDKLNQKYYVTDDGLFFHNDKYKSDKEKKILKLKRSVYGYYSLHFKSIYYDLLLNNLLNIKQCITKAAEYMSQYTEKLEYKEFNYYLFIFMININAITNSTIFHIDYNNINLSSNNVIIKKKYLKTKWYITASR
ncbi:hypothetical protein TCON_1774 [Astathelohania contejeani]|uniref:Uncharacterized protein n=1 Tax=Astathelohania contejeani TaxID=164912 RepID=A0ABQ7HXW8_9MICR|nr:hypothetical protein TCON_1774 [Thelohania contejeani]